MEQQANNQQNKTMRAVRSVSARMMTRNGLTETSEHHTTKRATPAPPGPVYWMAKAMQKCLPRPPHELNDRDVDVMSDPREDLRTPCTNLDHTPIRCAAPPRRCERAVAGGRPRDGWQPPEADRTTRPLVRRQTTRPLRGGGPCARGAHGPVVPRHGATAGKQAG